MSIKDGKVKIYFATHRNRLVVGGLMAIQFVLTFVLAVSLAGQIIWPEQGKAAAGTPMQLSYEGRLTDSSGNALGGTGQPYCYRFSIYDSASAGNKLWPGGTPTQTISTTTDGVFNAVIGQADTLSSSVFDFSTTSTSYLNVEVNTATSTCGGTWEALTPRQPILSSAYALQANNVYGAYLKTDTVNGRVQVGTGAGAATPIYLGLDVKNVSESIGQSCSTNGLMWYNSASSQALVCSAGSIARLGNVSTTSINSLQTNTGTPISNGTVVFSNGNGVTFGAAGSTITASVAGAGGAATAFMPAYPLGTTSQTMGAIGATTGSAWFFPVVLPNAVQFNVLRMMESASYVSSTTAGSQTISSVFGIYSNNAGTLSLISSNSFSLAISNSSVSATFSYASTTATTGYGYTSVGFTTTANIQSSFGTNAYRIVGMQFGNTMSLPAGVYWLGMLQRQSTSGYAGGLSTAYVGNSLNISALQSVAGLGDTQNTSNYTLRAPYGGFGVYTSTGSAGYLGTALPSSAFMSGIANSISVMPLVSFIST